MAEAYEFELAKAADVLVRELFKLKRDETCVITADTLSDRRVVNATAAAAHAVGAKPMVIWTPTPSEVAKGADRELPLKSLIGALIGADAWVEYNCQYLEYSTAFEAAFRDNKKLRMLAAVGMYADMMVRMVGKVNYPALEAYLKELTDMTKAARYVRTTSPGGTDVKVELDPERPVFYSAGYADTPGFHTILGQIGFAPKLESVNGVVVFDGSVYPPIKLLKQPIKLHIRKGVIEKIEGGSDAAQFEEWLKGWNDPQMLRVAHGPTYGCCPSAQLTGNIAEDERVWGSTNWGFGYVGYILVPPNGISAPSHTDGIVLNTSLWLDDQQMWEKGKPIHPKLVKLAKELGK
jgi:leucyl aminopeptidase (aminopeptidase T)